MREAVCPCRFRACKAAISNSGLKLGSGERAASDALGEERRFAPVVVPAVMLPRGRRLFEAHPVLRDEIHERRRGVGHDAVRVFAVPVVNRPHAQCPDDLNPRVAVGRESVRGGHHPAQMRRRRFGNVVLKSSASDLSSPR